MYGELETKDSQSIAMPCYNIMQIHCTAQLPGMFSAGQKHTPFCRVVSVQKHKKSIVVTNYMEPYKQLEGISATHDIACDLLPAFIYNNTSRYIIHCHCILCPRHMHACICALKKCMSPVKSHDLSKCELLFMYMYIA